MPEQITIKELERLINTTTFKSVAVKQRFQAQLRKLRTEERKRDVAADVAALHQEVTSNLPPVEAFSAGRPGFAAPALPPSETPLLEQLEIDLERHGAFLEPGVKPSRRKQFTLAQFRRVLRTFIELKPEPPSSELRDLITKVTTAVADLISQLSSVEKKHGRPDNANRLQAEGNEFEKAAREYAELIAPLVFQGFRAEAPAKTFAELTGKKTKLTSRDLGPVVPVAPSTRAIISDEAQIREVKVPKAPSPFGPAKSVSARTQEVLPLYPVAQAKKTRAAGKQARRDVLVPVYRGALADPASGRKPYFGAVLVNPSPYGIEAKKKSKRRNVDDGGNADYDDADYDDYDDADYAAAQDGDGRIIVPASLIQMTMLRYTLSYPMEKGAAENAIRVMRARTEKIVGSKRKDRVGLDLYTSGHFIIDFFRLFGAWSAAPPSNTTSELVSKWNSYRELLMRSTQALLGYAFMVATPLTKGRYVSLNEARIETRKARLAREWEDILSKEPPALAQDFVTWVLQVTTLGQLANDVKQTGVDNKFDPQLEANFNVFLEDVFAESNYTNAQVDALTESIRKHIRRLVPRQRAASAAAALESEKNKFLAAQGDFIAQEAQRNYDYYTNPEHVKLSAAGMVVRLLEEAGTRFDQSYATFCEYRTDNAWLAKQSTDPTSIAKLIKSARGQFIATINQMTADKQLGPRENAGERADDIMDSPEIQGDEQAPSPWVGESGTAARAVDDRDAAGSEAFIIDWLNESNTFFGVLLDPSSQVYRHIEGDLDDPDAYETLEDSFQTFGPHNVVTIAQYYRQYAQDVQGPAKSTSFRTYAGPAEYYSAESSSVYGNLDADDDDFDADDYGRMNSGGARTAIKKPRLMVMRIVYENDVLKPAEVGKWSQKDIAARAEYEEASREAGVDPDPMAQFSIQDRGFATKFRDALHGMFSTATDSQDDDLGDIVFSGEDDGEEWDQEYVVSEYPEVFRVQFIWPYASEPLALSDVFLQPDLFGAMLSDFILRQVLPETCDGEVFNHLNYYLVSRYQDFGNLLAASSEESGLAGTDTVLSSLRDMYGSPEPGEYSKQFAQDAYPYGFMHVVGSGGGGGAGAKVIVGEPTEDSPGWKYATYPNLRELDDSEFVQFGLPSDIVDDLRARSAAETAKARDTRVRELLSQAKVKTVRAASTKMPESSNFMPMWPDTVSYIENNLEGTYDAVFKAMNERMYAWANVPANASNPEFMLPAFNPPESFITAVSKDALKMGDDRSQVITNAIEFWLKTHQAKEDSVREAGLKADLDQRAENAALLSNPQNPLAPARFATRQLIYQQLDDIYFPLYARIFGDDPEDSLRAVQELDKIGQQMLARGVYDFLPYRAMAGLRLHLNNSKPGLRGDVEEEIESEPEPEPEMPRENRGQRKSSSAHAHARPRRALTPRENAQFNALTEGPAYIVREAIVTAAPKHQNNLRNAFRAAVAALTKRGLVTTNTGSLELTTKGQVAERKLISKLLKDGKALRGVVVTYERLVRMEQRRREVIAKLQNNVREMAARTNPPAPRDNPSGYALSGQTQMRRMFDPRVGAEVMTEVVEYRPQVFQDRPTFKRGQKQHQGRMRIQPPYRPRIYLPVDPDHPTTQAFYEDISVPTHETIRKTLDWSTRQHNAGMNPPTYAPDEMVPMGRKWRGAGQRGAAARATQVETLEQQARKKRDAEKAAKPKKEPRTPKSKAVASAPVAAPEKKAPEKKASEKKAPEKKALVQQVVAMEPSDYATLQVKVSRHEVQRLDKWLDLMDADPSTDPNARNEVLAKRNENARIAGLPERAGLEPASTPEPTSLEPASTPEPTSKFKMPARKSKAVAAVDVTDAYEHTTPPAGARNRNLDIDISLAFQYRDHGRDVLEAVPEYTAMVGALRKKQNLKGSPLDLKNARTIAVATLKAIADGQESGFNPLFDMGYITQDTLLMLDAPGEPQYVAKFILDLMQRAFT